MEHHPVYVSSYANCAVDSVFHWPLGTASNGAQLQEKVAIPAQAPMAWLYAGPAYQPPGIPQGTAAYKLDRFMPIRSGCLVVASIVHALPRILASVAAIAALLLLNSGKYAV